MPGEELTLAANGRLRWTGGTMEGTGKVIIPATAQLVLNGGNHKNLRERTIDNLGTTTWTGTGDFRFGDGAVFNNLAGAVFDVQNNEPISNLGGAAPQFNNAGTFQKTVAVDDTPINIFFNNTGTIDPGSGTFSFTAGGNGLP